MARVLLLLLIVCVMTAGCQPRAEEPAAVTPGAAAPTPAPETPEPEAQPAAPEVKIGMTMAEVREALGAPEDSRHEHGPGGSEIDIWTYKDSVVRFENGKVSGITAR